jgi:hypothetical protein
MLYQEIVNEAKRLPLREQLRLMEELARNLRHTEEGSPRSRRRRIRPFSDLRGALKSTGVPPTDAELRDLYVEHLAEKYS